VVLPGHAGDEWDYDAVQKFVLADLNIAGKRHKVLMQANKNGFFYVLDRASGKVGFGQEFRDGHLGLARRHQDRPSGAGGRADYHNSVLTYRACWARTPGRRCRSPPHRPGIHPVNEAPNVFVDLAHNGGSVGFLDGFFTIDGPIPDKAYDPKSMESVFGKLPVYDSRRHRAPDVHNVLPPGTRSCRKTAWEKKTSDGYSVWDGGVLSTPAIWCSRASPTATCASTRPTEAPADLRSDRQATWERRRSLTRLTASSTLRCRPAYGGVAIYAPIPPSTVASKYINTEPDHRVPAGRGKFEARSASGAAGSMHPRTRRPRR